MQYRIKAIRFLGQVTAATGVTLSTTGVTNPNDMAEIVAGYQRMDVLVNVVTLGGGTTPNVVAEVKENFSDAGFIRTAIATSTSTGGSFILRDTAGNFAMGKGEAKQVIITTNGSPTGVSVNVYLIFSNNQ